MHISKQIFIVKTVYWKLITLIIFRNSKGGFVSTKKIIFAFLINVFVAGSLRAYGGFSTVNLGYSFYVNNQQNVWQSKQGWSVSVNPHASYNVGPNNTLLNRVIDEAQKIEKARALQLQQDNLRKKQAEEAEVKRQAELKRQQNEIRQAETRRQEELKKQEAEVKHQEELRPHLVVNNHRVLEYFAEECSRKYTEAQTTGDQVLANRYQQRANAIKATVEQNGKQFDYSNINKHPPFTDQFTEVFNHCYGSTLDKQLHEELCDTRTTMMQLQSSYPELIQVKTISPVVNHFTALAKEQTNSYVAFNLSDFCYHLTKAAQGFGKATQIVFKGVGKGLVNTVEHNVAFCKSLVTHPIDDIATPLCHAGIALGRAVYYATELAINDLEKFNKKARDIALGIGRYARDKPEEAIAGVVELLLPLKAPSLVKLKQVQSLVAAVQEQEKFVRAVQLTSKVSKKITAPIKEGLADVGAIVNVGLQRGKIAMQNLIKVAEQQPEMIVVGDIAAMRVPPGYFDDFEKLSNEVSRQVAKDIVGDVAKFNKSQILQELEKLNDNKMRHLIEGSADSNHKWEKLVPDKNWDSIKSIIHEVLETGEEISYKTGTSKVKTIKGEQIQVTYKRLSDGTIKIGSAWIK